LSQAPASAFCHWGIETQCTRGNDTSDFKADILTCPGAQQWGITYDDGPNPSVTPGTPGVRASLKADHLKATFFVLGSSVALFPAELKATYADGHQIALHSWSHHPFTNLTNLQVVAELKYNERIIYDTVGVLPLFFRPPYGDIDDRVRAIVNALGYRTVIWTAYPDIIRDSQDTVYVNVPVATVAQNITEWFQDPVNTNRGFISLEHDAFTFSSALAVSVLNSFNTSGSALKPMPVGDCVGMPYYLAGYNSSTLTATTTSPTASTVTNSNKSHGSKINFISSFVILFEFLFFSL